jgi:glycosyltransferase involved in cell wall biosynthesis
MNNQYKILIFYAFYKDFGGAENMFFDLREHYKADIFAGSINFNKVNPNKSDFYSNKLFDPSFSTFYLHKDSELPIWYAIKRQLYFLISPKIKLALDYDYVIFSGNVFWVQRRLKKLVKKYKKSTKLISYINTPPRRFTVDQNEFLSNLPFYLKPFYRLLSSFALFQYKKDLLAMDTIISNSINIKNRTKKYIQLESTVIYPPVNTHHFQYISTEDFFLSHSRLENSKRIKLIVDAFGQMLDKKLIICSAGPLKKWLENEILTKNYKNILYLGRVSDEKLSDLVGTCLAGIVIPSDEDFGIVQCEIMSAGKPVIGVNEGGLLETVIDGKTGLLLPANPSVLDLIQAVSKMDNILSNKMKDSCIEQATKFSSERFFKQFDNVLEHLLKF